VRACVRAYATPYIETFYRRAVILCERRARARAAASEAAASAFASPPLLSIKINAIVLVATERELESGATVGERASRIAAGRAPSARLVLRVCRPRPGYPTYDGCLNGFRPSGRHVFACIRAHAERRVCVFVIRTCVPPAIVSCEGRETTFPRRSQALKQTNQNENECHPCRDTERETHGRSRAPHDAGVLLASRRERYDKDVGEASEIGEKHVLTFKTE